MYDPLANALQGNANVDVLDLQAVPEYQVHGGRGLSVHSIAERLEAAGNLSAITTPLVLVGWSFGGVIAQCLASRLPTPPAHLVVLDSIAPVDGYKPSVAEIGQGTLLDWCAQYLEAKRGTLLPEEYIAGEILEELLWLCTSSGTLPVDTSLPGLTKIFDTYVAGLERNSLLTAPHHPVRLDVPITAVRATRSLVEEPGALGYQRLSTSDVTVHTVAGSHYSMLIHPEPVSSIAHIIDSVVAAVRESTHRQPHHSGHTFGSRP